LAEHGFKLRAADRRKRRGRNLDGKENHDESVDDQTDRHEGQPSYAVAAEIFVDQIGSDEDHRPGNNTDAQSERPQRKQFPAGEFAENGVGDEKPRQGEIHKVSSCRRFHAELRRGASGRSKVDGTLAAGGQLWMRGNFEGKRAVQKQSRHFQAFLLRRSRCFAAA
jgi:hypothetical protein